MIIINPFRICAKGLRLLGYTIIILVGGITGISYYAVVGLTWAPLLFNHGLFNTLLAFLVLFLFHLLLGMLLWCYLMVVFSDPGSVPDNWKPLGEEVEEGNLEETSIPLSSYVVSSESISVSNSDERRNIDIGGTEYCTRCGNGKPPRCHHCSVCQRCVLKMDHHCIWLVNCVGARNYKFFLLFLLYTFAETTLDVLILMPSVVKLFREGKFHTFEAGDLTVTLLAFLLNVVFALCLLCFVGMHASLLSSNTTSIEVHLKRKDVRWKYDLGRKTNFEQVFGSKKAYWLLPLFAREDLENIPALQGLDFPTRLEIEV